MALHHHIHGSTDAETLCKHWRDLKLVSFSPIFVQNSHFETTWLTSRNVGSLACSLEILLRFLVFMIRSEKGQVGMRDGLTLHTLASS